MANTLLNEFVARGTAADRAAFVPDEPANTLGGPTHGYLWWETDTEILRAYNGSTWDFVAGAHSAFQWTFGDGVNVLTDGIKLDFEVPFDVELTAVRLVADASGNVVFDLWKKAFASLPPTSGDSIAASAKPTLSGASASEDTTLSGWTTACAEGDWLRIAIDPTPSTITRVTMSLRYRRT